KMACEEERKAGGPAAYQQVLLHRAESVVKEVRRYRMRIPFWWTTVVVVTVGTSLLASRGIKRIPTEAWTSITTSFLRLVPMARMLLPAALVVSGVFIAASGLEGGWLEQYRALAYAAAAALGIWGWHLYRTAGRSAP